MGVRARAAMIAAVAGLLAAAPAAAQQCDRCYDREDGSAHVFGNAGYWYTYMWADCNSFNACHGNSQSGTCSGNHWGCGVSLAMLVERLNTSIVRGDVARVGALIAANPSRVRFDPATGRVAIRDCDGKGLMAWTWQASSAGMAASHNTPYTHVSTNRRTA